MPCIQFNHVEKYYNDFLALPALNLDLDDGEFTVLVGPSGCGKSTTLRILAGLESLTSGEIYFDNKPISNLPPKSRDLAMVFQDYALYPHMNIAKNMSFALRLQKIPKNQITKKVKEVAEMLNIAHLLDRKPNQLSGGQRQRVAMGRALVRDASTFLFDEPLSNLDAKLRAKMRIELAEMRDQMDKNMIYVTHDQVEAMTLGQRIVIMDHGKVQQQGSPEELYKYPKNTFVAGFIGSPSMNFLDATWEQDSNNHRVVAEHFSFDWQGEVPPIDNHKKLTIGFRPTHAHLVESNTTGKARFNATSIVSEYLGSSSILTAAYQNQLLLIELPEGQRVTPRSDITIGVNFSDLYLFDRINGNTIYPTPNS